MYMVSEEIRKTSGVLVCYLLQLPNTVLIRPHLLIDLLHLLKFVIISGICY